MARGVTRQPRFYSPPLGGSWCVFTIISSTVSPELFCFAKDEHWSRKFWGFHSTSDMLRGCSTLDISKERTDRRIWRKIRLNHLNKHPDWRGPLPNASSGSIEYVHYSTDSYSETSTQGKIGFCLLSQDLEVFRSQSGFFISISLRWKTWYLPRILI